MTPEELPTRERRLPLAMLAQLAEIVASLAVVATLVYLVVEVRQNTEVTQAAAYDRSTEGLNQWRSMVSRDPELARLWGSFQENGEVDQERVEEVRLQLVIATLWECTRTPTTRTSGNSSDPQSGTGFNARSAPNTTVPASMAVGVIRPERPWCHSALSSQRSSQHTSRPHANRATDPPCRSRLGRAWWLRSRDVRRPSRAQGFTHTCPTPTSY